MFSERRKSPRRQHLVRVILRIGAAPVRATTVDLSATGAFVATTTPAAIGDEISLLCRAPGDTAYTVQIIAVVARVVAPGAGPQPGLGVHFKTARSPQGHDPLSRFLKQELGVALAPHETIEPYRFGRVLALGASVDAAPPSPARAGPAGSTGTPASPVKPDSTVGMLADDLPQKPNALSLRSRPAGSGSGSYAARNRQDSRPVQAPSARRLKRSSARHQAAQSSAAETSVAPPLAPSSAGATTQFLGSAPRHPAHQPRRSSRPSGATTRASATIRRSSKPDFSVKSHQQPVTSRPSSRPQFAPKPTPKSAPKPTPKSAPKPTPKARSKPAPKPALKPRSKPAVGSPSTSAAATSRRSSPSIPVERRESQPSLFPKAPRSQVLFGIDSATHEVLVTTSGRPTRGPSAGHKAVAGATPGASTSAAVPYHDPARPLATGPLPKHEDPASTPLLRRLLSKTSRFFGRGDKLVRGGEAISAEGRFYVPGTGEVPDAGDAEAISRITGGDHKIVTRELAPVPVDTVSFLHDGLREINEPITLDIDEQFRAAEARYVDIDTLIVVGQGREPAPGDPIWLHLALPGEQGWHTAYLLGGLRQPAVPVPQGWCAEFMISSIRTPEETRAFRDFALSQDG